MVYSILIIFLDHWVNLYLYRSYIVRKDLIKIQWLLYDKKLIKLSVCNYVYLMAIKWNFFISYSKVSILYFISAQDLFL